MEIIFIIAILAIILSCILLIFALCKASSIINRKEEKGSQWEDDMWRYGDEKTEDWD